MPAPDRPCERRGPWRIVGQILRSATSEQELDHFDLTVLGRPGKRRRTEVLVTRGQISTRVEQFLRLAHVAFTCRMMERRDAQPIVCTPRPVFFSAFLRRRRSV